MERALRSRSPYGGVIVKFKPLLDRWKKHPPPQRTATEYAVRLPLDDASRLLALIELFPGVSVEEIVTDLLHAGLDEIAAAMPYEPGPAIISRDDHGDPVYEDIGMTPRFVELARKHKKTLEAGLDRADGAPSAEAAGQAPPAPKQSVPVRSTRARSTKA
jgi:hypothetical protein